MSLCSENQACAEEGLIERRNVDLVNFSLTVAYQLERNSFPRAGRALAIGAGGFSVATEAYLSDYFATIYLRIKKDPRAFSARNEDEG